MEKDHSKLEQEVRSRQSNILPLDAARNEGRFYGLLIKTNRQLTGVQRIGFLLLGALFLLGGSFEVNRILQEARLPVPGTSDTFRYAWLIWLLPAALFCLLGLKLCLTALIARSSNRRSKL